jgi:hypothetical protein
MISHEGTKTLISAFAGTRFLDIFFFVPLCLSGYVQYLFGGADRDGV